MILACLKPLTVLLLPFLAAWLITSYAPIRSRALWLAAFGSALTVAFVSCLPALVITAVAIGEVVGADYTGGVDGLTLMTVDGRQESAFISHTAGLLPYAPSGAPAALNEMHSRGGEWAGRDYVRDCGAPIYAPFAGTVSWGGAGVKDSWGNPYIYLKSDDGRYQMLLMHGDYALAAGDSFRAGQQVGSTNLTGYFIGSAPICHDHVSLLVDGVEVDPEQYRSQAETAVADVGAPERGVGAPTPYRDLAGLVQALRSLGYSPSSDVGLRISHYEPAAGGINCDSDCGHMASGDVTWDWTGGKGGVYAAACPPAWPFGTRFSYAGATYECRDRGGWIQCYEPGAYDKALKRDAETSYCWVDLYNTPPVGYGTLAYDWQFIK
ncbi:MAG: M23 family metallopeptidase [Chloroflexi bacterium]|nr:M23 family metallopeptidase [Chloroflexota bacterium]